MQVFCRLVGGATRGSRSPSGFAGTALTLFEQNPQEGEAKMLKKTAVTAGMLVALLVPAAAEARGPHIDSYKVRDIGSQIFHRIDWCTGAVRGGYEYKLRAITVMERGNGGGRQSGVSSSTGTTEGANGQRSGRKTDSASAGTGRAYGCRSTAT